jgi:hypothetical protein
MVYNAGIRLRSQILKGDRNPSLEPVIPLSSQTVFPLNVISTAFLTGRVFFFEDRHSHAHISSTRGYAGNL